MRSYPSAVAAHLASRDGVRVRVLVWFDAKDRATGEARSIGFWSGGGSQTFQVGGVDRVYLGGGAFVGSDALIMETGIVARMMNLSLSPLHEGVAEAVRGYDLRLARAEIHQAFFDPISHDLLAEPSRVFRGWVNEAPIKTAGMGGDSSVTITLASNSLILTRLVPLKKSDEALRARVPGDGFRRYADVSGSVQADWGR